MSVFVLVHGAWHGSWCWKRVRSALQAQGHEVFTPTLTGVGERSHLLSRDVNLETHINDVVNLIRWEELENVVLCGHSYGGAVVSGVADRLPERISALVYLDAFVLENGQSLHDLLPPEQRQMQLDGVAAVGEGWKVPPIPAEVFGVNAKDAVWVNRQCTMQPLGTFQQKLSLTEALDRVRNVSFILAQGFTHSPFPQFFEKAKSRGWNTYTVPCGHDVMLDMPEELTRILLESAALGTGAAASS
jgi:pimeloyl-ACP methyl ester carboxylesterase